MYHPMKKQSITFTDPQISWLEKEARKLGISVSDAVRRVIDQVRQSRKEHADERR